MVPEDLMKAIWNFMQTYHLIEVLVISIIVAIIYIAIRRIVSRFRSKGFISRGTEETIRFVSFTVLSLIVLAVAVSYWLQNYITAAFFITILAMFIGVMVYSIRTYIENALSYLIFVTSNIVKDGENVKIDYGGKVYEGRINITEGSYATIATENKTVFIPYSVLLKSVITKSLRNVVKFRLRVKGQNLELDKVIENIRETVKDLKMINRESIDIKPLEIKEDEIILNLSFEVPNPRNIEECYEMLVKLLTREIPYRLSFELIID